MSVIGCRAILAGLERSHWVCLASPIVGSDYVGDVFANGEMIYGFVENVIQRN